MKLEKCNSYSEEYISDLTKELDKISGISQLDYYDMFYHYILADSFNKQNKCLAIRVPEGTLGAICFDDHDTSDNRKENLRLVSASQNASNMRITSTNKSGIKGVCWSNKMNKWMARAMKNYKSIHLGYFDNINDAKKAREKWEINNQKEYRYQIEQDIMNNG